MGLEGRFKLCCGGREPERVGRLFQSTGSLTEGSSTRRLEVNSWKTKESSIGGRAELGRRNIQLEEIREEGAWLFNDLKVKRISWC